MSRLSLVFLAALAACRAESPPPGSQVTPGLPVIAFTDAAALSVLDVPAAQMRATLQRAYELKPDRRFLGAVAEVHRLVTGEVADTVRVSRKNERWAISYRNEQVGELRDLPAFDDASALLETWATRQIARHAFGSAGPPSPAEAVSIRGLLARLDAPQISAALRVVDSGWVRGHNAAWLPLAASGLTLLAIQLPKVDVVGDAVVSRALAATVLASAAGYEDSVIESRVLLAEHMGYTANAAHIASRLPVGNPVRLVAGRDRPALRTAATKEPRGLTRFLYVRVVADLGERHGFREAVETAALEAPSSGTLGAAVTANRFETDALLISTMPRTVAAEMGAVARRPGMLDRLVSAIAALFGRRVLMVPGGWSNVLQTEAGGGRALAAFEQDAQALGQRFAGPFLSGDLYALYFRAQLHAAFERACIHYVDGLSSVNNATDFVSAFDGAPAGLWSDVVRWCAGRTDVIAGRGSADRLVEDLRSVQGMSEPAARRSLDDIVELIRYLDAHHLSASRAMFDRLDSRPHELRRASVVALYRLVDVPLAERLDARLIALAGVDYPDLVVWYGYYRGDVAALVAHANDRTLTLEARFEALSHLLDLGVDSVRTFKMIDRLLAEDPQNWDERDRYIDILEEARRFPDAARVAREWLASNGEDRGFDYLFATTALAREYQYMGRLQEAYDLLAPLQQSWQSGVLQRSALISLGLGENGRAERLARRAVDRYPGSATARSTLAQILWAQHRDADAVAALHDPQHVLSQHEWRRTVGPVFARTFGRRPLGEGQRVLDALTQSGVPATHLEGLPAALADSGYYPLALSLKERLLPPPGGDQRGDDGAAVEFYRYVVAARGEAAGLEWLGRRWPPREFRRQALSIYRNGLYDLLWDRRALPDDGPDGSYYWLIRVLAWLQDPQRDPARGAQLNEFYRRPDARFYQMAGRCLLGMEPAENLLLFATDPHRRAEVSYYLGIKALSERRYNDASDWLRVSVETGSMRDWEILWAKDLLTRWSGASRELRVAVPQIAAKPPVW